MLLETYFKEYLKDFCSMDLERFNYPYGCILMGAAGLYEATGDESWLAAVKLFGEKYVDEKGVIRGYAADEHNVDLMCSGNVLYFLYQYTGEQRFKDGINMIMENLREQPRTSFGNFWHKQIYPNQVWLDGLYMAQPFYLRFETLFNNRKEYNDITTQFQNVRKYIYDDRKQLYYHAYDETRKMVWADKKTGCSPCFWLRGMGWYLMALADCYEIMPEVCEKREIFAELLREAVDGLLTYQDKAAGLFYQLIDRKDLAGNYLETSGSAMAAYAILKGCRLGMLDSQKYEAVGKNIMLAIAAEKLEYDHGCLHLTGSCASAGLGPGDERDGSPEYYLSEAVKPDNYHGVAACILAYGEWLKLAGTRKNSERRC